MYFTAVVDFDRKFLLGPGLVSDWYAYYLAFSYNLICV